MKAIVKSANLFRSVLGAVTSQISETDVTFSEKGVSLRAMDPSHITMVDFKLPPSPEIFLEYDCPKEIKTKLNLDGIGKYLGKADPADQLSLEYDDETNKLNMVLSDKKVTKKYRLATLAPTEEEVPSFTVKATAVVTMPPDRLAKLLSAGEDICDNVLLEATDDKFTMRFRGETNSADFDIVKGTELAFAIKAETPTRSVFNVKYLSELVRNAAPISQAVHLRYGNNTPMRLDFTVEHAELYFIMAPRVEKD